MFVIAEENEKKITYDVTFIRKRNLNINNKISMIKQMLFQLLCYGTYGVKIALINNVNMIIYHVKIS